MDIWRAAEVLNRRKWLIIFSVVVVTVLIFGATRLTGSRWQATVRLISPQTASRVTSDGRDGNGGTYDVSDSDGKAARSLYTSILLSREVVMPAYEKIKEQVPSGSNPFKNVEFNIVGPRLFEVQVTDSKPEKAELLANALAESFVQRNHSLNTTEGQKVVDLLQSQIKIADAELAKARNKYRVYSRKHKIIGSSDDEAKSAHSEIDAARARRNEIAYELAATTARQNDNNHRLAELAPFFTRPLPALPDRSSKSLSQELDTLGNRLAALKARYGDQYPAVKETIATRADLAARLQSAQYAEKAIALYDEKTALRNTLEKNAAELTPKIAELQAQNQTLDASIASAETRAQDAKGLSDPFGSLASEVAARTEARSSLAQRLNRALLALDVAQQQNPIVILESVNTLNPAVNITAGRTTKLLIMGALCALIGSCGIIVALDSVDRRVKNVHEAEKYLPARILAAIPQPETPVSYSALARISELNPRSLPAEAYRFLGLHLLTSGGASMRSLMVVSAKAEQGSTTTVTNLAITLAQAGHRVVLVDANIRTPELHQVFETENGFGFTDLLMDPTASSFEKALLSTETENLQIITSGSTPDNPWELFRSSNLKAVSRKLRDIADYVLYDTPSGVLFTDALNLAPIIDGAFLCVRALETPTGVEKRLVDMINQADVTVLGAVLNDVPVAMVAGYENYRHYYAPALPPLPALALNDGRRKPAQIGTSTNDALNEDEESLPPYHGREM